MSKKDLEASIREYCQKTGQPFPERKAGRKPHSKINVEVFLALCMARKIPAPEVEYRFHPERQWRFDFAWRDWKIALECQGGIFSNGGHVRGSKLIGEYEKLNAAAILGWRILYCTPQDISKGTVFAVLEEAFRSNEC